MNPWPRAIILADMNAFFASIEQHDFPALKGRPLAITNGESGTCIITCSYEARAYGIKTGMRLKEAKVLCPSLIARPSRPKRYGEVSKNIMASLVAITPDIEIFSVDEAFLDVTRCQRYWGDPVTIGHEVKKAIFNAAGILCSIGISGDKTTAKYAAKIKKPDGFEVIPPWESPQRLSNVKVEELCGIGEGIRKFLAQYGVITCGDMAKIPISVPAKRFGNLGRRLWLMCQGVDPEPVQSIIRAPKSMGHGKVMPPNTKDKRVLLTYLHHMAEKLAARLRRHQLKAKHFFIGWKSYQHGWIGEKCAAAEVIDDGKIIYTLGQKILENVWSGEGVYQIQVTALDPQQGFIQPDFFLSENHKLENLHKAMDNINQKYGEFTVAPLSLLHRSSMNNVISPAWKPEGHRQSL